MARKPWIKTKLLDILNQKDANCTSSLESSHRKECCPMSPMSSSLPHVHTRAQIISLLPCHQNGAIISDGTNFITMFLTPDCVRRLENGPRGRVSLQDLRGAIVHIVDFHVSITQRFVLQTSRTLCLVAHRLVNSPLFLPL